jgi:hypothetical protein
MLRSSAAAGLAAALILGLVAASCGGGDGTVFGNTDAGSDSALGGSGGIGTSGSAGEGTGGGNGGKPGTGGGSAGTGGSGGCSSASDCDDGIPCTRSFCVLGKCSHTPVPSGDPDACPAGQHCDPATGCVASPVCADSSQCEAVFGSDACKANIACDPVTATCKFEILDRDEDGHPPIVCGGDDCDDSDEERHPELPEACDGKDNDCNLKVDDECQCFGGTTLCDKSCVDTQTDPAHCGGCDQTCETGCKDGKCCPPPLMLLLADASGSAQGPLWTAQRAAITSFLEDPETASVRVGLQYHPLPLGGATSCDPGLYAAPAVPLGSPATAITDALGRVSFGAASAIAVALTGTLGYVRDFAAPGSPLRAVVLLLDSPPNRGCSDSVARAVAAADAGFKGSPSVSTYLVSLGTDGNPAEWDQIAQAGGTQATHAGDQGAPAVLQALRSARDALLTCR